MKKRITTLEEENLRLKEQVAYLRKHAFGRKTEKTAVVCEDQLSLFDEAEQQIKKNVPEPEIQIIKEHKRKKYSGQKKELLENLPPVNKYEKFIALGDQLDVDAYRKMINEQNCFLEINTMYGTDVFSQSLDVHSLVLMMDYYNFSIEEKKQIMAGCMDEAFDW